MSKLCLLIFFFPLLLVAQTPEYKEAVKNRDKYLFAVRPENKKFIETVSFSDPNGEMVVPVTINGNTYHFLFDTGAATVISDKLQEELALQTLFKASFTDGAGTTKEQQMYLLPSLQLGNIKFNTIATAVVDLSKFEQLFCIKIDGIFGTNIMRTCRWKIDYKSKTITFSDKKIKPVGRMESIKFTEGFSGSPMIKHYVGEYNYMSLMDTGYNGGFTLPDSLFFKSRKKTLPHKKSTGKGSLTIFDQKPDTEHVAIMDSIYMNDKLIKNQVVKITPSTMPLTGNEVFSQFGEIIIDWDKQILYVADVPVKESVTVNTFGFNPEFDNSQLQVGMLWEDSNAKQQGLELGDVIIALNGTDTRNMLQEKWCGLVTIFIDKEDNRKQLELTVLKKDGHEHKYTLEKYNIFK